MSDAETVAPLGSELTPAERRVLEIMRSARAAADAAQLLSLSRHTVHAHLRNVRSRYGAFTTRELLVKVLA